MTAKTGKHAGDKLLHAISCDTNPATLHFMNFPYHKLKATQVPNGLPYIISEELLTKPYNFITRSVIERATMYIWDFKKCTFTNPNELHSKEEI